MDRNTTIFLLASAVTIGALAFWQDSRRRPLGQVTLVPWTGLLFTAVVLALFLTIHLLALFGLRAGSSPDL